MEKVIMNKLLLVGDKKITTGEYEIEYQNNLNLNISGDVKLINFAKTNYDLNFKLEDNTTLDISKVYVLDKSVNLNIDIFNNSLLKLNILVINTNNNILDLNINMLGNNSKAIIKLRVINQKDNDNIDIRCNGRINENTFDNELIEDLKGLIINDDSIKISPNMYVFTNEVMANHLVTISSFNQDELFYLESKGIKESLAKAMIKKSFVLSNINEILKDKILEVITFE